MAESVSSDDDSGDDLDGRHIELVSPVAAPPADGLTEEVPPSDAEAVAVAPTAADEVAVAPSGATTACYKWPKASDIFKGEPDQKLLAIVNQAIAERPWESKSQGKAWDMIAANLSAHYKDIFPFGISGNQALLKFKMILSETKKWNSSAPFRSGGDNEAHNSFVQACEDAEGLYQGWKDIEGDKKAAAAASKDKDKMAAEAIRRASIGKMTRKDLLAQLRNDESSRSSSRSVTPVNNDGRSTPSSSIRTTIHSINDVMESSVDKLSKHQEAMERRNEERAIRKKQKLDLAKARLEEERIQAAHVRSMEVRCMELEEQRMALDREWADEEKAQWTFFMNNQKKE